MQICNAENKMRNSGSVSYSLNINVTVDCFHAHLAVKIARFYPENMRTELPKIKAQADHNRKLRVNARKITRNYCVKCPNNSQLAAVFLREIAECI